jgi:hypothetical protein
MAQTPIVLLAMDFLLKGDGLAPSRDILDAIVDCKKLEEWTGTSSTPVAEGEEPTVTELWPGASDLADLPRSVVLGNLRARIGRLLGTVQFDDQGTYQIVPDEQAIRRFVSIFQASSGASATSNGILDSAAALNSFKSFTDFGPNINNIQDLVTGGKTGSFPGGAAAMSKLGDNLKGFGSMYDTNSLADLGKASSLIKNLSAQGALPSSVTERLSSAGIDINDLSDDDETTLKKVLSEVGGSDLLAVGRSTGFPVEKLGNLGDALDASKVLSPAALSATPSAAGAPKFDVPFTGALYAKTADEDLTYTGDDYIVWERVNAERLKRNLPGLEEIGSPQPEKDAEASSTSFSGGGDMSSLGAGLQTVAGTGNFSDIGKKLSGTKVPDLKHLMAAPPDFSQLSDSLKGKFTSLSLPPMNEALVPDESREGLSEMFSLSGISIPKNLSAPSMPGHIPKVPNIPGVPSIPLKMDGFAAGGAIDTSLYTKTPDEDLTYTGDDHIVWDRVNTERLNRGLPDLAAIGSPRPEEPPVPATATPNGTPGVFQMLGSISSEGPILEHLQYLVSVSKTLPNPVDVDKVNKALAQIQMALDQEQGALTAASINLKYDGPTGYMGVTGFAEKLHQYGVDKQNLGLGRFIEELGLSADSRGGDAVIAALYEGRNLAT